MMERDGRKVNRDPRAIFIKVDTGDWTGIFIATVQYSELVVS